MAAWYALEQSASVQAPFSTGLLLTQALVHSLVDVGLIDIEAANGSGIRRALYEPLVWRYRVDVGTPTRLRPTLQRSLAALSARMAAKPAQRELWEGLADAELETYLAHLLRRHAFDPARAGEIVQAMHGEWDDHCLARRRYLVWTGTRGGAAALVRSNLDQDLAQKFMIEEMRRRSRWLSAKQVAQELPPTDYCFMPESHWKRPILLDLFIATALDNPRTYWTAVPDERWLNVQTG
ncbi:hypothetical protein L3D22_07290 [Lysobacter soli]|uniref:hypothetical protein n=1 Tax=Lysobacter soli TaxID=453783 RepID=UPI0020A05495|nr:hypothetical protein [Lysobacter soli]UTA55599.1 hypothetical protein L3D22_07290 [Lysobacter soli]